MRELAHSRFGLSREAHSCYIIAEAGSNHNRDWVLARRLVEAAAEAKADAVKFQMFRAERLYPQGAGQADYLGDATDIYDIVRGMELPDEWLPRLYELCAEAGLDLLVTPFDEALADVVEPYVPVYKLASYELTHEPLIKHIAAKGKPMLMSTGAATENEIAHALSTALGAGAADVVLLQCTASYPAKLAALNVAGVAGLRERFGVPAGLSDHSEDPVIAPVLSVGVGAVVLEKHFTLDRKLPGPDHRFAVEPAELARLVSAVRAAETALGQSAKEVHPDEQELRAFARRVVFAIRDLQPGDIIDAGSVAILRRGKRGDGLPPSALPSLIGRRVAREVSAGSPLQSPDVEP